MYIYIYIYIFNNLFKLALLVKKKHHGVIKHSHPDMTNYKLPFKA